MQNYAYPTPIWEEPEVIEKVNKVMLYINTTLAARNFFAWRDFVDDLRSDVASDIYKYEELHRQGKYQKTGAGGYCRMALQAAINYTYKFNAHKRRANYEALSLDAMIETANGQLPFQLAAQTDDYEAITLLASIEQSLGPEAAKLVERILDGQSLGEEELKRLRLPKLKQILKT